MAALCACGCGRPVSTAKKTSAIYGHRKGEPVRFIRGHGSRKNPHVRQVLAESGDTDECIEWPGNRGDRGYGHVQVDGRLKMAHRVAYELAVGPIPDGLQIDHLCRNTCCINPRHLEPVTCAENVRRGSNTKLTADDVRAIRADSRKQTEIAAAYGITFQAVSDIQRRRTWSDVA